MVFYECKRCGYCTTIRTHYGNHLQKRKVCKPILADVQIELLLDEFEEYVRLRTKGGIRVNNGKDESTNSIASTLTTESISTNIENIPISAYTCDLCRQSFKKKRYLAQHLMRYGSRCRSEKKYSVKNNAKTSKKTQKKSTLKGPKKEQEYKKEQGKQDKQEEPTHQKEEITPHLLSYGCENMGYISQHYLKMCQKNPITMIPRLTCMIHYNIDHPENHNIRMNRSWSGFIQRYENNEWKSYCKEDVLCDLIDQAYIAIDTEYEFEDSVLNYTQKQEYEHFRSEYDSDNEALKNKLRLELIREIQNLKY